MIELKADSRILLVRTDNIGDVLLTLPALASLRRRYPKAFIAYLCRSYTAPLFENNPDLNQVLSTDDGFASGLKFEASVHFYVEPKGILMAACSKIKRRIGPRSKIWSALLTERIVQNRSRVEKHEAEYNLDLVKALGADGEKSPPRIYLSELEKREGWQIFSRLLGVENARPVVLHPGTKGHAESWPLGSFIELAAKIGDRGIKAVFTAGKGEEKIVEEVRKAGHKNVHAIPAGSLNLRQLSAAISQARLFVGNSSGPLHIATAVNVPTISFFPETPLVTSSKRWGPFGSESVNRVFSPADPGAPLASVSPDRVLKAWTA